MANGIFNSNVDTVPAVSAEGDSGANGVDASSDSGTGVSVFCIGGTGVFAQSVRGTGVSAISDSDNSPGVFAQSRGNGIGLHAVGGGATPSTTNLPVAAIFAEGNGTAVQASDNSNQSSGIAVQASSASGTAVFAQSGTGTVAHPPPGIGVHAVGGGTSATTRISQAGIFAEGGSGNGVVALTTNGTAITAIEDGGGNGVSALSNGGVAVLATANGGGNGVNATSDSAAAVGASSNSGTGVEAISQSGPGVSGASASGSGVQGHSDTATGVSGVTESGFGVTANGGSAGVALQVIGKVEVQGKSVGSVAMAAGTKTLKVNNVAATANSLIFLTPLEDPQAFLWIGARNAGSFTIDTSKALPAKVTIVFLIIN